MITRTIVLDAKFTILQMVPNRNTGKTARRRAVSRGHLLKLSEIAKVVPPGTAQMIAALSAVNPLRYATTASRLRG
jgi:hypothetical protein